MTYRDKDTLADNERLRVENERLELALSLATALAKPAPKKRRMSASDRESIAVSFWFSAGISAVTAIVGTVSGHPLTLLCLLLAPLAAVSTRLTQIFLDGDTSE